jgi:lycopene cyclase domain-containing protein
MKGLYLLLDLIALSGPLLLSFDKRVAFYKNWPVLFPAIFVVAIPFVIHDEFFTRSAFWGFNPDHLIGVYIGHLPLEELLFFIIVPYACVFIYACCNYYFQRLPAKMINRAVQLLILSYIVFLLFTDATGWYTASVCISSLFVLLLWMRFGEDKHTGLGFVISLIPFFIMNGILTGTGIEEPVVWYNEAEKIPGRILTIPFEDVLYAFTMIVGVILVMERLNRRNAHRTHF